MPDKIFSRPTTQADCEGLDTAAKIGAIFLAVIAVLFVSSLAYNGYLYFFSATKGYMNCPFYHQVMLMETEETTGNVLNVKCTVPLLANNDIWNIRLHPVDESEPDPELSKAHAWLDSQIGRNIIIAGLVRRGWSVTNIMPVVIAIDDSVEINRIVLHKNIYEKIRERNAYRASLWGVY